MKKYLNYVLVAIIFLLIGTLLSRNMFYEEQTNIEDIVYKSETAVVAIETISNGEVISKGSGFIYKVDNEYGYILTNNHVVENSSEIKVALKSKELVDASIVGSDIYSDIAILKIDKKYAKDYLILGSSNNLNVGQTILTISSPISPKYIGTVTKGIISGLDRQVTVSLSNGDYIIDSIQIDAAINQGSSGGAVLDLNGKVVGIIYSKLDEQNDGIGFVIPIDNVKDILTELEKGNEVKRPTIGINACNTTDTEKLLETGVIIPENITGVVVLDVYNASPLEKAGIQKGDIIYSIEDIKVSNMTEFKYRLYKYSKGDKIKIKYYRNNEKRETKLNL